MAKLTSDDVWICRRIEEKKKISFPGEKWPAVAHGAYWDSSESGQRVDEQARAIDCPIEISIRLERNKSIIGWLSNRGYVRMESSIRETNEKMVGPKQRNPRNPAATPFLKTYVAHALLYLHGSSRSLHIFNVNILLKVSIYNQSISARLSTISKYPSTNSSHGIFTNSR